MTIVKPCWSQLSRLRFSCDRISKKMVSNHIYSHELNLNARYGAQLQQHENGQQLRRHVAFQASDDATMNENNKKTAPQEIALQQQRLFCEASSLTRALYRKCLRSIKLLANANDRDEKEFEVRESNRFDARISMMTSPVDRTNELNSRFEYYKTFARENFDGHFNLLGTHGFHIGNDGNMTHGLGGTRGRGDDKKYQEPVSGAKKNDCMTGTDDELSYHMWREEQIAQFIYLIKSGEEKRQWILNDYGFDDVYNTTETNDSETKLSARSQDLEHRLRNFETQSKSLVRAMYKERGWAHSTDHEQRDNGNDDDDDDDDKFFEDGNSNTDRG